MRGTGFELPSRRFARDGVRGRKRPLTGGPLRDSTATGRCCGERMLRGVFPEFDINPSLGYRPDRIHIELRREVFH